MSTGAGGSADGGSALGGLGGSLEDKNSDLLCPVCFELIQEAYVTRCGHSFCYTCIGKCVDLHRRCPKCGAALASRDHVFPNFLLNELVAKRRLRSARPGGAPALPALLAAERLPLPDVEIMLDALARRKRLLQAESRAAHHRLLVDFLTALHRARRQQLRQLTKEADLVKRDLRVATAALREIEPAAAAESRAVEASEPAASSAEPGPAERVERSESAETAEQEPFAAAPPEDRWRRLHAHFDDFVQCYFAHRSDALYFPPDEEPEPEPEPEPAEIEDDSVTKSACPSGLDAFREDLVAFTRYRALRPLASLSYSSDAVNYSSIVSTIEFDKDEEFFAIAGVTKRIKVFEFAAAAGGGQFARAELAGAHKVSSVAWNSFHKQVLAAADYEGCVSLWDAGAGRRTRALHEHDRRAWSVHWSAADVRLLASGSDDSRVKLWALDAERSVATLEAKYNVCCVRFNPKSSVHLAFGSADHCVHYYDLRAPRRPLAVLKDHRKAVSYVKFLDASTLVSASTDSQLKLWRVDEPRALRSFSGHANEKNFVGLATDGEYVACGSENNALYVYYRGLSRPLLAHRFDGARGLLERARDEEPGEFVSAVCWRRASPVLLAANSQGLVKLLELV